MLEGGFSINATCACRVRVTGQRSMRACLLRCVVLVCFVCAQQTQCCAHSLARAQQTDSYHPVGIHANVLKLLSLHVLFPTERLDCDLTSRSLPSCVHLCDQTTPVCSVCVHFTIDQWKGGEVKKKKMLFVLMLMLKSHLTALTTHLRHRDY